MKGIIFTEFLGMVEEKFSPEMVEKIIDESNLPNQGGYTEVGTYDHHELLRLVKTLSEHTKIPIPELEEYYGEFLFNKFLVRYPRIIMEAKNTFEFLKHVDDHIHVEVKKLYPEAELPRFECSSTSPHVMMMYYHSNHPFASLAIGLMKGCASHYGENLQIESKDLGSTKEKKYNTLFTITKKS